MGYTRLSLVLTDRCNAACDFCSLSCGPDGQKVMDRELMLRVIREAKALGFESVEFTGGEPFLYPELLEEGARAAREEKLGVVVATNGFWGGWDEEKIVNMLKAVKPNWVNVSTDFFHSKYVPVEHVVRVVQACAYLDISYRLLVADMEGAYSAGRYIHSLGSKVFSIGSHIYPVRRCGRALNLPEAWFLPTRQTDNMMSVFYDGNVYLCDVNEACESAKDLLGNALKTPLQEMLSDSVRFNAVRKEPESDVRSVRYRYC